MKLVRGMRHVPAFAGGTVATIGNFDGVHLGHQALLSQLKKEAIKRQLPLVVLLFEPQPSEFFIKENAPARLSSLREKLDILAKCNVDYVYCLKFNKNLANMSPVDFATSYFFSLLQVRYLLIGEDFRFGRARLGDVHLLKEMSDKANCLIDTFPDFAITNLRVSSTKIREALANGQLAYSATLLGRTFSFCGRVITGAGRGRQWGIPTANIGMRRPALPLSGVFCVQLERQDGALINGVANLGRRPTVDGTKNVLEIHLFDFNDNLYGEMVQVYFLHKLRDEIKFPSAEDLIKQIHEDIARAKGEFKSDRFRLNKYQAHLS